MSPDTTQAGGGFAGGEVSGFLVREVNRRLGWFGNRWAGGKVTAADLQRVLDAGVVPGPTDAMGLANDLAHILTFGTPSRVVGGTRDAQATGDEEPSETGPAAAGPSSDGDTGTATAPTGEPDVFGEIPALAKVRWLASSYSDGQACVSIAVIDPGPAR